MNKKVFDFIEDIAVRHGMTSDEILDEMYQDYLNNRPVS